MICFCPTGAVPKPCTSTSCPQKRRYGDLLSFAPLKLFRGIRLSLGDVILSISIDGRKCYNNQTLHTPKKKKASVHPLLCDPGWFRRTEKPAAKCSPLNTLQSEARLALIRGTVTKIDGKNTHTYTSLQHSCCESDRHSLPSVSKGQACVTNVEWPKIQNSELVTLLPPTSSTQVFRVERTPHITLVASAP